MVNEVIDYLLLLTILDPKDMTCFKVNDMRGVTSTIVELEFIYTEEPRFSFRFDELAATIRYAILCIHGPAGGI